LIVPLNGSEDALLSSTRTGSADGIRLVILYRPQEPRWHGAAGNGNGITSW